MRVWGVGGRIETTILMHSPQRKKKKKHRCGGSVFRKVTTKDQRKEERQPQKEVANGGIDGNKEVWEHNLGNCDFSKTLVGGRGGDMRNFKKNRADIKPNRCEDTGKSKRQGVRTTKTRKKEGGWKGTRM